MNISIKDFCALIVTSSLASTDSFRQTETKDSGRTIHRMFYPTDRYLIDTAPDYSTGWKQFDTYQDAPYFGVWLNKATLQCLTYAEGDWCLVQCKDAGSYNMEVIDCKQFYDRDSNRYGDRQEFLIASQPETTPNNTDYGGYTGHEAY